MNNSWLAPEILRTKADCSRVKTKFLLGQDLLFALPAFATQDTLLAPSTFPGSATPAEGDPCADEVFGNDRDMNPRSWLVEPKPRLKTTAASF
jgi:hypothetical protein